MAINDTDVRPILRFGVLGLGQAAAQALPALAAHPNIRITAAVDVRQDALDKFAQEYGGETHRSVEELCASADVDVVHIATPHNLHVEHTLAAVAHGKHVVLEKPMALSLEDCDRMIEAVERAGVLLVVDRGSHGFDPPIHKIREMVRSGEYGRLGMINSWHYGNSMYAPRTPAELDDPPPIGGIFFRQGPHQIDLVRLIGAGLVRSMKAMTGAWDPERRAVGAFLGYLEFEDGAVVSFAYSGYDHFDTDEFQGWMGTYGDAPEPQPVWPGAAPPAGCHGRSGRVHGQGSHPQLRRHRPSRRLSPHAGRAHPSRALGHNGGELRARGHDPDLGRSDALR